MSVALRTEQGVNLGNYFMLLNRGPWCFFPVIGGGEGLEDCLFPSSLQLRGLAEEEHACTLADYEPPVFHGPDLAMWPEAHSLCS